MLPMDVLDVINVKAKQYDVPAGNLAAIVDVESRGKVFAMVSGKPMPMILYEPHLLYRRISGAAREEAVRLGLASKNWNKKLYAKSQVGRWQQIHQAAKLLQRHGLPTTAAFESASYGVGQVLGYHWQSLGYESFQAFFDKMTSGAEGQIDIMLEYCVVNHLDDELRDGRWPGFFRGYNGPQWEKGGYGKKIAAALKRYGGSETAADGMLRLGSKGLRVRELQTLLVRAGYQVIVDGDFGPATRDTLRSFQAAHSLQVDGVYGPETETALSAFRQSAEEKPGKPEIVEIDEVKQGAGGVVIGVGIEAAKDAIDKATGELQKIDIVSPWIDYALTGLSLAAAAVAIAGLIWALKGWMDSKKTVEV